MKDFAVPAGSERRDAGTVVDRTLFNHRLTELERRVGRIEAFLLGVLCTIAVSVLGGMVAVLNLPRP
ncbi:hypothetical protein BAL199_17298 [alpha proteobacterium BAL199]|jgi:hypothetical protein|nr:hypothetical protein BAL199_17298 [alpha proteobacterium BAL199]